SDDGVTTSFQRSRNSRPPMLDHQDKYMMKAQVHVSKSFAIFDKQALPQKKRSGPDWLFDIDALTRTMFMSQLLHVHSLMIMQSSHDDGFKPLIDDGKKVDEDPSKRNECNDQEKEDNVNNTNNVNIVSSTVNAAGTNEDNELPFDPNMPALEDVSIFNFSNEDEDDDIVADINNMNTTIQVSPTPTTRIHKDHHLDQVIRYLHSATQRRHMSKNLEEHGFVSTIQQRTNHKDFQNCLFAFFLSQEEPKKVIYVLKDPSWIEAMQEEILQFKLQEMDAKSAFLYEKIEEEEEVMNAFERLMHEKFQISSMRELTFFLGLQVKQKNDGIFISQDKYVAKILKKFRFTEVKNASTPMETHKPLLKDEDGEEVDVYVYRYQVNLKVSHLHFVKRIFRYLKGQQKLGLWYPKDSPFDLVAYTDSDYARASLDRKSTTGGITYYCWVQVTAVEEKPTKSEGFEHIVAFLSAHTLRYALTVNPNIYESFIKQFWSNAMTKTINGESQIHARVGGKEIIITGSSVRRDLRLADEEGVDCFPNSTIFENLELIGKVTEVPQPSEPTEYVANEAIYKELDDRLVRAATIASSLEAEQDSGNIDKTQSKATPNEASSSGTTPGGGPRGNTLRSDEDSLKLNELMELCTNLQSRVLDLEKTKTTQALEITSLKRRVKKLEKKQSLGEDAFKQGMKIHDIDANEDITLVSAAGEINAASIATTISAAATITTDEITLAQALVEIKTSKSKAKGIVLQDPSESTTTTKTISSKQSQDKGKAIMIEEPVKPKKKDQIRLDEEAALKLQAELQVEFEEEQRLARETKPTEEKRNKPPTQAQQRKIMCTYLKNVKGKKLKDLKNKYFDSIQKVFDRAFKRVNTFVDFRTDLVEGSSKRAGEELTQGSSKKQKVDDNKDTK
nr:hypothetical protein [Tanacetum cinerariifolium]